MKPSQKSCVLSRNHFYYSFLSFILFFFHFLFYLLFFKVWATMRNPSKWDQESKSNITVAALDVTSEESIAILINEIIEKEGKSDPNTLPLNATTDPHLPP